MNRCSTRWLACITALVSLSSISPLVAQQKGQWEPGQMGLNAGIMPDAGISYINIDLNYSASTLNNASGSATRVTGNYNVWVVENIFYYVPKFKVLGGNLGFMIAQPTVANGSLVIDLGQPPIFSATGLGGYGFADTYVQPVTLGWHLPRADVWIGYAFFAPTGRYTPGATNNIGSGYLGNDFVTGSTLYLTKNKATSLSLFTNLESHGSKQGANNTSLTPGGTWTDEWGLGQVVPLKKDFSRLLQVGLVGYDQLQVTANGGSLPPGMGLIPANRLPFYSVHSAGIQSNFILPKKNLAFNFKYYWEYSSKAHPLGDTLVFGLSWTFRIPKPPPPTPPKS